MLCVIWMFGWKNDVFGDWSCLIVEIWWCVCNEVLFLFVEDVFLWICEGKWDVILEGMCLWIVVLDFSFCYMS